MTTPVLCSPSRSRSHPAQLSTHVGGNGHGGQTLKFQPRLCRDSVGLLAKTLGLHGLCFLHDKMSEQERRTSGALTTKETVRWEYSLPTDTAAGL